MRFWTSSETYKNVTDKLRFLETITSKINDGIKDKSYGDLEEWAYMIISAPDELLSHGFFKEIKRYRKTKKEVEFRLRIDNEKLAKANEQEAYSLIGESILRSIDIAELEFNIENFDFKSFRNDLLELFRKEGWI